MRETIEICRFGLLHYASYEQSCKNGHIMQAIKQYARLQDIGFFLLQINVDDKIKLKYVNHCQMCLRDVNALWTNMLHSLAIAYL